MAPKDESPDGVNLSRRNFLKSTGVVGLAWRPVVAPGGAAAQSGPARGRSRRRARPAHRERPAGESDDRAARDAAGCAPHARRPHGQQARVRPRRVWRVHDARRRPPDLLLLDARDRSAGQADSQRRRSGKRATLHPVQQAFCDKDALMCGFCTPGFIMASVGLLEKHPNPTPRAESEEGSTATSAGAARSRASSKRSRA